MRYARVRLERSSQCLFAAPPGVAGASGPGQFGLYGLGELVAGKLLRVL